MKSTLPVGVIGVGSLGQWHAKVYAALETAQLVGVHDENPERCRAIAAQYGTRAFESLDDLLPLIQAASVVVPTVAHFRVASRLLQRGIHVLVEKPITDNADEAEQLVELAAERGAVLQVGHVERYNPVMAFLEQHLTRPRFIEALRLAPFPPPRPGAMPRGTEVSVVLDLMIHDLDLVLWWMGGTVKSVDAFGGSVFTPAEDMASAILKFDHGGVAHLTASRVAMKAARKMRLFAADGYASLDFQQAQGVLIRKQPGWEFGALDLGSIEKGQDLWKLVYEGLLQVEQYKLDSGNPLDAELRSFLAAVRERSRPVVSGEDACAAVAIAERVLAAMRDCRW